MANAIDPVELRALGGALVLRPPRVDEAPAALAMLTDPDVAQWNAYAGNISVFDVDLEQAVGSVGYRVAPAHRGRGVATAALAAVRDWAFAEVGLVRLQLFHAVPNAVSCRVAERDGFAFEGVLRSASVFGDGERYDEHLHARLASDP